ncbi:MAG: hypothetical protein ACLPSW_12845 [Roseiarcus sp.]
MAKTNLKVEEPRSPQREALASAIANLGRAEDDLRLARAAAGKVRDRAWAAQDRLEALRSEHQTAPANPAGAFIAAMREGRDAGVAELVAPTKTREVAEADIQREIDALTTTRAALDRAIPDREKALSAAKSKLAGAVAEVLRSETDVPRLLKEAEAVAADIVAQRAMLMQLRSLLPAGAEKSAIESFIARPWLVNELNGQHPTGQAVRAAYEALLRDADAALGE